MSRVHYHFTAFSLERAALVCGMRAHIAHDFKGIIHKQGSASARTFAAACASEQFIGAGDRFTIRMEACTSLRGATLTESCREAQVIRTSFLDEVDIAPHGQTWIRPRG